MLVVVLMIGPRDDLSSALTRPIFIGSLVALLLTLASGGFAAFVLSVPGAQRSRVQSAVPILTAAAWFAMWLVAFSAAGAPAGRSTAAVHAACAILIAVCALATGWFLFVMIARAAPLRPLWTAAIASLASMAAGAAVAQVFCPADDPKHQLVGHVVIALVVAGSGLLGGWRVLSAWHRR